MTLETTLINFLKNYPDAQDIDGIEGIDGAKADFLLNSGTIVCEIKSIKGTCEDFISETLQELQQRPSAPFFYGSFPFDEFIKGFEDKDALYNKVLSTIGNKVENSTKKASKQIQATMKHFKLNQAKGVLIYLNETDGMLSPDTIAYRIAKCFKRLKKNGEHSCSSIHLAIVFSVIHFDENSHFPTMPVCYMDNNISHTACEDTYKVMRTILKKFSESQGIMYKNCSADTTLKNFKQKEFLGSKDGKFSRFDVWRLEYRRNRYLEKYSDEGVLEFGLNSFKLIIAGTLKNHKRPIPSSDAVKKEFSIWTHFLEECHLRLLNLKLFSPYRNKALYWLFNDKP